MLVVTATCGAPLFPRLTPATSTSTRLAPTSTATTGLTVTPSAASVIGLRKKEFVFFLFLFLVFFLFSFFLVSILYYFSMAIYTSLPAYKEAYDLCLAIFRLTDNFSRQYRYALGEDLKNRAKDLIILIYRANRINEKKEIIDEAREKLESIRLLLRLVFDLKICSMYKFVYLSDRVERVSKHLSAWSRYYNN